MERISGDVDLITGDLRHPGDVQAAVEGTSHVIHLGALGSVQRSIENPHDTHEVNVTGTLNVLSASQAAGVRRVVFASSSSVYGDTDVLPKVETMALNPLSPYAASKAAGELYCRAFQAAFDIETVILRYFNVFGPRQDPNSQYAAVVPRFAQAMLDGERPTIFGDGLQSRDFTYVSNVVAGTIQARDAIGATGGAFNLGSAKPYTILDLVDLLNREIGTDLSPQHGPPRPGDVRDSYADITSAAAWGYEPTVDFESGITATVEHLRQTSSQDAK